jgi:ABC-type cobalamin/Fe3+-siderophores transport system ATPase subunit
MKAPKKIKSVKPLANFKLLIEFDDGNRLVDMKTFDLVGNSKDILKDEKVFNSVYLDLDHGVVTFDNGIMLENNELYVHGKPSKNIEVAKLKKVLQKICKD